MGYRGELTVRTARHSDRAVEERWLGTGLAIEERIRKRRSVSAAPEIMRSCSKIDADIVNGRPGGYLEERATAYASTEARQDIR